MKIDDIVNTLLNNDAHYSIAYWSIGDENTLNNYIKDDAQFYGVAYRNNDNTIGIYRFAIDDSDLEEWLAIGLTENEINYISKLLN